MDRDDLQDALDWARDRALLLALFLGALVFGCHAWTRRAVTHGPGVLAPEEPQQVLLKPPPRWNAYGHAFTGLASFEIHARVLSTERYRFDPPSVLSPVDFALGWGPMSDSRVLERLTIVQDNRWFHWAARELPIPESQIISHAANMHMIPADAAVRAALLDVREGEVVRLRGKLVRAESPEGFGWVSSLSRTDTGDGACEVVWVDAVRVDGR
ncbi:MAG: hypothetical protein U0P81_14955 [Holophagaceae bacterium]